LLALKASGDSTSTDNLVRSAMVLDEGVGGVVGWKTKLWDGIRSSGERRQQV